MAAAVLENPQVSCSRMVKCTLAGLFIRQDEVEHIHAAHIIRRPPKDRREWRVDSLQNSLAVNDQLHILCIAPEPVPFLSPCRHLLFERLIEFMQGLPARLLS